jgi:hypothetical protein
MSAQRWTSNLPDITRVYAPDREAMLASLRLVLGLPPRLARPHEEQGP